MAIEIDAEFRSLIPSLREDERQEPSRLTAEPAFRLDHRLLSRRADELCSPPTHRGPPSDPGAAPGLIPFSPVLSVLHTAADARHPSNESQLVRSM